MDTKQASAVRTRIIRAILAVACFVLAPAVYAFGVGEGNLVNTSGLWVPGEVSLMALQGLAFFLVARTVRQYQKTRVR